MFIETLIKGQLNVIYSEADPNINRFKTVRDFIVNNVIGNNEGDKISDYSIFLDAENIPDSITYLNITPPVDPTYKIEFKVIQIYDNKNKGSEEFRGTITLNSKNRVIRYILGDDKPKADPNTCNHHFVPAIPYVNPCGSDYASSGHPPLVPDVVTVSSVADSNNSGSASNCVTLHDPSCPFVLTAVESAH